MLKSGTAIISLGYLILVVCTGSCAQEPGTELHGFTRERISINNDWRFYRYDSMAIADTLVYDVRPLGNPGSDGGHQPELPG